MTIQQIIDKITKEILNPAIILLFAAATVIFFWGIVMYLGGLSSSPNAAEKGKNIMLGGIIGMFIMASAWGIVKIFCDFFGTGC